MPVSRIAGVGLYWELQGRVGEPLVLVHGSWTDHHSWAQVVPALATDFRVVTYDRRGHSLSERPAGQGSIHEDVADLAALIEHLGIGPAHVIGSSGGGAVALGLAARRPDLFRSLVVHEPPVFALLEGDASAESALALVETRIRAVVERLAAGDDEGGARLFVETIAFGPGAWGQLPQDVRATFVRNAPTFLDETRDPESLRADLEGLRHFKRPALLTRGEASAPFFPKVIDRLAGALPQAVVRTYAGAGHVPHITHPADYVRVVRRFLEEPAIAA